MDMQHRIKKITVTSKVPSLWYGLNPSGTSLKSCKVDQYFAYISRMVSL